MDKPIDLVPLVCPKCTTRIPANPDEVAWVCAQCGQGLALDADTGLSLLEINFSKTIASGAKGMPYWVSDGQVSMHRESFDGGRKETDAALQFWSQPRRIFIPAYTTASLDERLQRATQMLVQPPTLQPGSPVAFEPVSLPEADIQPAAEFIVMAIEAGRKDKLKKVDFVLKLAPPVLWILP
jgi:hypothetical protein